MDYAGSLVENTSKRRREKGGKQMRRKRALAAAQQAEYDRGSEPEYKGKALTQSDGDTSSTLRESSTDRQRQRPCTMCGFPDDVCECSALSDGTYSSTHEHSSRREYLGGVG
ncbi:hypothetical protein HPB50_006043 [Hyalomma asiaticum]|uniref:Uncharacterized protein n=1 Tax=Hyalomma asiaticum TaxID=266040 RepID=A0ACB7RJA2_HYAAI|nr:hypothetical protein HPB50_006043 [Hyalomma asiaticum]